MKFCSECGEDLKGSKKFCPECGFNIGKIINQKSAEVVVESNNEESIFDDDVLEEPVIEKTTRELGTNLEDMVEKILADRGFSTETRSKLRGTSGQLNEIDIIAKRDKVTIAVECKNYAESKKVGIKEIRDFSAKLDDLNIKKGLFVTSADFSQDAIGWAMNNPQMKQIDLWNGDRLSENMQAVMLGRSSGRITKVSDCLDLRDTIANYSDILLKNKQYVTIVRRDLSFHPYYIVQFTLREQFKTPDKQIHSRFKSGQCIVDGLTRKILFYSDDNNKQILLVENDEQKQIIYDLTDIDPHKTIEIQNVSNSNVIVHTPSMTKKDVEFSVRKKISEHSRIIIPYYVRKSKQEAFKKEYTHVPSPNSIDLQSKVVSVPKLEIVFDSKEYSYRRDILPASDITLVDEISECRHRLRKKHTFAVCEICGIAKCEDDIFINESDQCFCKEHAPEEVKESNKGKSIRDRLNLSFGKK